MGRCATSRDIVEAGTRKMKRFLVEDDTVLVIDSPGTLRRLVVEFGRMCQRRN